MKRTTRQQTFYIIARRAGQAGSLGVQRQVRAAGVQERPGHVPDQLFHEAEQLIQVLAEGELCLHHPEFGEVAAGATPLRSERGVEGVHLDRTVSLLCYLAVLGIQIRIQIRLRMFLGPPGSESGSVSHKYGSGCGSFHHQTKKVRNTWISTVL